MSADILPPPLAFGWKTTFQAAIVGWTHSPPPSAAAIMVFLLAGVLCDVVYVGMGLFLLSRCRRVLPREFSFILLAGTLLTAFSIRWAISPVFVMINASDESGDVFAAWTEQVGDSDLHFAPWPWNRGLCFFCTRSQPNSDTTDGAALSVRFVV